MAAVAGVQKSRNHVFFNDFLAQDTKARFGTSRTTSYHQEGRGGRVIWYLVFSRCCIYSQSPHSHSGYRGGVLFCLYLARYGGGRALF
jgi:hypothetical protein